MKYDSSCLKCTVMVLGDKIKLGLKSCVKYTIKNIS